MCNARNASLAAALTLACALAAGCVPSLNGNEPREPDRRVPPSFGAGHDARAAVASGPTATAAPPLAGAAQRTWRELFKSPELRSLIESALAGNRELNARFQEIVIAESEVAARQGEILPKVGVGVGAGIERVGENSSQGRADEATGLPQDLGDFAFGLTGSWEVDIWGKLRDSRDAARARYLASIEARSFMITELVAEIARSYFELIALDNQLDVLRRNIQVQSDALDVVRLQKVAARVTELAVQRFEAEVLKNRSRISAVEQERVQAENRINFLVGRYPQHVTRSAAQLMDPLPDAIRCGLPSELLENRPDVRRAELELEAARLDVDAARASFYPALSIDASVGYRSFRAEHLLMTPESVVYGVAGHLVAPLLNRQAIETQYRSANARQVQAVFEYEGTLLQAFTDVVNQLAGVENLRTCAELQAQQVATLTRATEVSMVLFQSARADYMEVLLTRRDALDAQMELIETRKRQLQASVSVYQALGGGWRTGT